MIIVITSQVSHDVCRAFGMGRTADTVALVGYSGFVMLGGWALIHGVVIGLSALGRSHDHLRRVWRVEALLLVAFDVLLVGTVVAMVLRLGFADYHRDQPPIEMSWAFTLVAGGDGVYPTSGLTELLPRIVGIEGLPVAGWFVFSVYETVSERARTDT
jgi:hypothetical protein